MPPSRTLDPATVARVYVETGSFAAAGKVLGCADRTVSRYMERWDARSTLEPIEPLLDTTGLPVEELLRRRSVDYGHKAALAQANSFRRLQVHCKGPIGILHFGDPHVDDDGTDVDLLFHHAELTRKTEGLFAANIGDVTNNWVGTLARLYGEQGTSAKQGRVLAEHFMKAADWLYIIGGNHDWWTHGANVLDWFAKQYGYLESGQFQYHAVRLGLVFPNGREYRINARHDFKGSSEHHPTHGPAKASRFGFYDHILICGHRHTSGYEIAVNPDPITGDGECGLISHCIRVGTYKKIDSFAREKGLPYQNCSPAMVTILNPEAERETKKVLVFLDADEGAEYLGWLRRKK